MNFSDGSSAGHVFMYLLAVSTCSLEKNLFMLFAYFNSDDFVLATELYELPVYFEYEPYIYSILLFCSYALFSMQKSFNLLWPHFLLLLIYL